MDNWKKDILKIPNLLSLLRLGLIPIYISIFLNARSLRDYWLAGGILALSCLTDLVDGYIARKYDLITTLGKLLDPIADKFTQLVLTICLSMKYPVLWPVLILFLIKEFFQFFAALAHYRQGKALDGALMSGKICTCVLFGGFTLLMFIPNMPDNVINLIAFADGICLSFAFIQYIFAFFGKYAQVHDIDG